MATLAATGLGGQSLAQRIERTRGHSTGFDYMRITLAAGVVFWHAFTTAYGVGFAYAFLTSPARPIVAVLVPMFFALSGWLVAGSLFRNSVPVFLGLRALRIGPALAVETLLSAFILGPILTTVGLGAYFTSPLFFHYLANMVGWIHYQLPGLFLANPVPNRVNGQLWTVPWELWCYIALTLAGITRLVRVRLAFLSLVMLLTLAVFWREVLVHGRMDQENGVAPPALLLAFLSAVCLYLYRDKLPYSRSLFVLSTALLVGLLFTPGGDYLIGFPAAYATVWLGLQNPRKIALLRGADYSYGLYIYHYVIEQSIAYLLPTQRHWYVIFPITIVVGGAFAAFSWRLVEKPALRLKEHFPRLETALRPAPKPA